MIPLRSLFLNPLAVFISFSPNPMSQTALSLSLSVIHYTWPGSFLLKPSITSAFQSPYFPGFPSSSQANPALVFPSLQCWFTQGFGAPLSSLPYLQLILKVTSLGLLAFKYHPFADDFQVYTLMYLALMSPWNSRLRDSSAHLLYPFQCLISISNTRI